MQHIVASLRVTLYSPSSMYLTLTKEHFANCQLQPLFATVLPSESQLPNIPFVQSKFGNVPKGCVLSYQQNMSSDYIINDFTSTAFPDLPLPTAEERFDNNVSVCLNSTQQASLGSLSISMESSKQIQQITMTQSEAIHGTFYGRRESLPVNLEGWLVGCRVLNL